MTEAHARDFGEFIDRYTIRERPGWTAPSCPSCTEGRTAQGTIRTTPTSTELFEDLFRDHTPEELEAIRKKYATKGQIFEAPDLIRDKARDMLRHYVTHIPLKMASRRRWWRTAGWRWCVTWMPSWRRATSCWPKRMP